MIFQAMDAAGKDGTIRHVMSGINPQGCQVFSFKSPSAEERDHDYLWRSMKALPERGRIGIHNRSYYEEVLVCRVHPEILGAQQLPEDCRGDGSGSSASRRSTTSSAIWWTTASSSSSSSCTSRRRSRSGASSSASTRRRRTGSSRCSDAKERAHWKDYMKAYEDVFTHTSTKRAPWYIIPADHKWFMRLAVAAITYQTLEDLDLKYPTVTDAPKKELLQARKLLMAEKG